MCVPLFNHYILPSIPSLFPFFLHSSSPPFHIHFHVLSEWFNSNIPTSIRAASTPIFLSIYLSLRKQYKQSKEEKAGTKQRQDKTQTQTQRRHQKIEAMDPPLPDLHRHERQQQQHTIVKKEKAHTKNNRTAIANTILRALVHLSNNHVNRQFTLISIVVYFFLLTYLSLFISLFLFLSPSFSCPTPFFFYQRAVTFLNPTASHPQQQQPQPTPLQQQNYVYPFIC